MPSVFDYFLIFAGLSGVILVGGILLGKALVRFFEILDSLKEDDR